MAKYRLVSHRYVTDFQNEMDEYAEKGYTVAEQVKFYPETNNSYSRYVVLMELQDGVQSL